MWINNRKDKMYRKYLVSYPVNDWPGIHFKTKKLAEQFASQETRMVNLWRLCIHPDTGMCDFIFLKKYNQ